MVQISQAAIDEVGRVSEALARAQEQPKRQFILTLSLDTEAFQPDQWNRELEVARILRNVSEALGSSVVSIPLAELRDRNGATVGRYEFREN